MTLIQKKTYSTLISISKNSNLELAIEKIKILPDGTKCRPSIVIKKYF